MKKTLFILLLLILPVASGCGKGDSGAKLLVTTETPLSPPSSKPITSKALLAATGDGNGDTFEDQFITPSAVTIGIKSFKFFKRNESTTVTPGQTQEAYTVLDADPTAPRVVQFQTGVPEEIVETVSDPREGTYDRVEYELTYVEMIIPLCREDNTCEDRRLRFYLTAGINDPEIDLVTSRFDVLLSQTPNGLDFGWISTALGLPSLTPITQPRPSDTYAAQISNNQTADPSIVSLTLNPPLEIPSKPKVKYFFTLHFDLANLFFFDNTDAATIDPTAPFHFNALVANSPNQTQDGKIRTASCDPTPATCNLTADFSPGLPVATVTVEEVEEKN